MPKISVVIPTYNYGHLLGKTIQSVLNQTFRDFEIIVIDDGSTDNTREVASTFPVRYFYQTNQKLAAARNKGVELAQGEYIAFLDSDDVLLKGALEKGVKILDSHPEAGFSYGQAYLMDEDEHIFSLESTGSKHSGVQEGKEELRKFLVHGNHITESTLMIRRSCFEEIGKIDLTFQSGSSGLEFWIRLAKKYPVACIVEPLVKYRVHSKKFCAGRSLKEWEETNSSIIESILNDAELEPIFAYLRSSAYLNLYSRLALRARERGDAKTTRHYLMKAFRLYPKTMLHKDGISIAYNYAYKWATLLLPKTLWQMLRDLKWHLLGSKSLRSKRQV